MNTPDSHTPRHQFRVPDDVWAAAMERATTEGTTLSALLREWTATYAEKGRPCGRVKRR